LIGDFGYMYSGKNLMKLKEKHEIEGDLVAEG
jgi:hypothetical protein